MTVPTILSGIFLYIFVGCAVTQPRWRGMIFGAVMTFMCLYFMSLEVKPLLAVICVVFYVAGFIKLITGYWQVGSLPMASDEVCSTTVFGTAGGHIAGGKAMFGEEKTTAGAKGEERVGAALEKFAAKYPGVRVFHGLQFQPGSKSGADIDHVVLIGRCVYLIDAKLWQANKYYSWGATQGRDERLVLRGGEYFSGGNVHMDNAFSIWSLAYLNPMHYPGGERLRYTLESRVVLALHGTVNNDDAGTTRLATLDGIVKELSARAEAEEPIVDRLLVAACKSAMHR